LHVPYVIGVVAVLGDDPEAVAAQPVTDRLDAGLAVVRRACRAAPSLVERSALHQQLDHRVDGSL
jgi:hypothetical protein